MEGRWISTPKPRSVSWKITENCNSRCRTCTHWLKQSKDELNLKECKNIIDQFLAQGIYAFRLTGGEPTLRGDLQQIVDYIRSRRGRATLNTNLLSGKVPRGIHMLYVALDGFGETYRQIRGVDGSRVVENLRNLKGRNLFISTILMKQVLPDIPKLVDFCREIKAKLSFNLIDPSPYFFSGAEPYIKDSLFEDVNRAVQHLLKLYNPEIFFAPRRVIKLIPYFYNEMESKIKCPIVYNNIKLGSRGELYPGCWCVPPIGDLRKEKLSKILESKRYRTVINRLFNHNCTGCRCGWMQRARYFLEREEKRLKF